MVMIQFYEEATAFYSTFGIISWKFRRSPNEALEKLQ